jgi:hypothetical protein
MDTKHLAVVFFYWGGGAVSTDPAKSWLWRREGAGWYVEVMGLKESFKKLE